ncbi:MAG: hypothetical protein AB1330_11685 [Bacillota bacterium]
MFAKISIFLRRYLKVWAALLSGVALYGAAVAVPTHDQVVLNPADAEGVKAVVLSWLHFVTNAATLPEPHRFTAQLPPRAVMEQRLNEIENCLDLMWADCPQKSGLKETLTGNAEWFRGSVGLIDFGTSILNVAWDNITVVGDKAEVTVTFTDRFGGFWLDGPPGLWVSEGTSVDKFILVKQNGRWKISYWKVVSGPGSAEIIYQESVTKGDLENPAKIGPLLEKARRLIGTPPEEVKKYLDPGLVGPYL